MRSGIPCEGSFEESLGHVPARIIGMGVLQEVCAILLSNLRLTMFACNSTRAPGKGNGNMPVDVSVECSFAIYAAIYTQGWLQRYNEAEDQAREEVGSGD